MDRRGAGRDVLLRFRATHSWRGDFDDPSRFQFLARPGRAASDRSGAGSARVASAEWHRHVGAGDQPPLAALLRGSGSTAEYVVTGSWGKYALKEAQREGPVRVVWEGSATNYDRLPTADQLRFSPEAAYACFTSNETIQGVQFPSEPDLGAAAGQVPLVCDASSDLLS